MRGNRNQDDRYYGDNENDSGTDRRREQFQYNQPNYLREHSPDLAQAKMSVKDIGLALAAVVGMAGMAIGQWSNINTRLLSEETKIEQLEKDKTKELLSLASEFKEHKLTESESIIQLKREIADLNGKVTELDSSISQIYSNISRVQKK